MPGSRWPGPPRGSAWPLSTRHIRTQGTRKDWPAKPPNAAKLGYVGKLCIHPGQVEIVHSRLNPSEARLAWARAVTDAFTRDPSVGVTLVDGRMVDKAHLRLARKLLALGGADG